MEQLFMQMLEKAKTDKKLFAAIKNTAVKGQQFELAANLRELEVQLFPESDEEKEAKKIAVEVNTVLRMVDLNVDHKICYTIHQALKSFFEIGGKFSMQHASIIKNKSDEIFTNS